MSYILSEGQAWVIMEALGTHPITRAIDIMRQLKPIEPVVEHKEPEPIVREPKSKRK